MSEIKKGEIRNRELARTLRTYSSLTYGNVTPTDIDGFVEFQNKLFIIIEGKNVGSPLSRGQSMALERMCDAIAKSGKRCVLIVCEHTFNANGDIDVGMSIVRDIRVDKAWHRNIDCQQIYTVKEVIDFYRSEVGI